MFINFLTMLVNQTLAEYSLELIMEHSSQKFETANDVSCPKQVNNVRKFSYIMEDTLSLLEASSSPCIHRFTWRIPPKQELTRINFTFLLTQALNNYYDNMKGKNHLKYLVPLYLYAERSGSEGKATQAKKFFINLTGANPKLTYLFFKLHFLDSPDTHPVHFEILLAKKNLQHALR